MRVFISYAHTEVDRALARFVAERLRACAIEVWMDESSLPGGRHTQGAIEEAAATCGHAVFLVSRSWLARDWTHWELGLFDGRTPPATLVPIWRRARKDLRLPPTLYQVTGFEWDEEERNLDARFWQLHCFLHDRGAGPESTWSDKGRTLGVLSGMNATGPVAPPPPRSVRPSLKCDRAAQWKTVDDLATSGANELLILPGAAGQAHEHFAERVQRLLRADPPRHIACVDWGNRRPASRDEYRDAVAVALEVGANELESGLRQRLAHENIVLLHACLRSRFLDAQIVEYYTRWLPDWIAAAQPSWNVKCVQPVEWPPETFWSSIGRRLRGSDGDDGSAKPAAEVMLSQLLERSEPLLRAVRLAELHDLSGEDLEEFCQVMALKPRQRTWLRKRIEARRPRTPTEVFKAIDDYIPDVPDERSLT
jgi:hypothetical protein